MRKAKPLNALKHIHLVIAAALLLTTCACSPRAPVNQQNSSQIVLASFSQQASTPNFAATNAVTIATLRANLPNNQAAPAASATQPPSPTVGALTTDIATLEAVQVVYPEPGGANARECPRTSCTLVTYFNTGIPLPVNAHTQGEAVEAGNSLWYRVLFNGEQVFVYSGVTTAQAPATQRPAQPAQPAQPAAPSSSGSSSTGPSGVQGNFQCPRNCDGARAAGLSAQQAASCGLDRDGDGVACYGD